MFSLGSANLLCHFYFSPIVQIHANWYFYITHECVPCDHLAFYPGCTPALCSVLPRIGTPPPNLTGINSYKLDRYGRGAWRRQEERQWSTGSSDTKRGVFTNKHGRIIKPKGTVGIWKQTEKKTALTKTLAKTQGPNPHSHWQDKGRHLNSNQLTTGQVWNMTITITITW